MVKGKLQEVSREGGTIGIALPCAGNEEIPTTAMERSAPVKEDGQEADKTRAREAAHSAALASARGMAAAGCTGKACEGGGKCMFLETAAPSSTSTIVDSDPPPNVSEPDKKLKWIRYSVTVTVKGKCECLKAE